MELHLCQQKRSCLPLTYFYAICLVFISKHTISIKTLLNTSTHTYTIFLVTLFVNTLISNLCSLNYILIIKGLRIV